MTGTGKILMGTASPRDRTIRNQMELVQLLAKAHLDRTNERIVLGDDTALVPEREQIVAGYILTAHVQRSTFTVEAQPVKVGKTGPFSYFRDEAGVIRFEMGKKSASAKPASANRASLKSGVAPGLGSTGH